MDYRVMYMARQFKLKTQIIKDDLNNVMMNARHCQNLVEALYRLIHDDTHTRQMTRFKRNSRPVINKVEVERLR